MESHPFPPHPITQASIHQFFNVIALRLRVCRGVATESIDAGHTAEPTVASDLLEFTPWLRLSRILPLSLTPFSPS